MGGRKASTGPAVSAPGLAGELYKHQREGVGLLVQGSAAFFADMGTGKTRTAVTAFREIAWPDDRLLVIAPKIARGVWAAELELQGFESVQLIGSKPTEINGRIAIINFDVLRAWQHLLGPWIAGGTIIIDESHRARNPQAQRSKACRLLAVQAARTWLLTGTPAVNSALDIYNQFRYLGVGNPFREMSEGVFAREFCNRRFNAWKQDWEVFGVRHEAELWQKAQGRALRVLEKDCLDLPPMHRMPMWVAAGPGVPLLDENESAAAALGRMRSDLAPVKAKLTIEYLEEALEDRPVVVFGYHHRFLNAVADHFRAPIISGDTSDVERQQLRTDFQAGKIPILVAQLQAAGVAIDLFAANHAVFGEIHWSSVDHRQAEKRIHRIGQTRPATMHYLLTSKSVDELVWRVVLRKGEAIDRLDTAAVNLREAYDEYLLQ